MKRTNRSAARLVEQSEQIAAKAVITRVEGKVQGVGFRVWLVSRAEHLGLAGWVRNRSDGAVEALIGGSERDVDQLVAECHIGPIDAVVTAVIVTEAEPPQHDDFRHSPDM